MGEISRQLETEYPESNKNVRALVNRAQDQLVQNVRPALMMLTGAVALVALADLRRSRRGKGAERFVAEALEHLDRQLDPLPLAGGQGVHQRAQPLGPRQRGAEQKDDAAIGAAGGEIRIVGPALAVTDAEGLLPLPRARPAPVVR